MGGFPAQTSPGPPTGSAAEHFYDDGYNRVDISGNLDTFTWYWGYTNASQLPGNGMIVMNSSSSASGAVSPNADGDPQQVAHPGEDDALDEVRREAPSCVRICLGGFV